MPGNFQNRNGATLAGHSDRKSEYRKAGNYHSGSRMSRNQQTGEQGRINAEPGEVKSTENMTELEKLRYVNSLGLLNATQKQRLADMERAEKEQAVPKEEPKPEAPKAANPVKELSDNLGKIFANKPQLIQGIVKALQAVPKEELKGKAQAVLDAMEGNKSTEPTEVFSTIMRALEGTHKEDSKEPEQGEASLDGILKTFDNIGKADRANAQQVKNVLAKLENRLEGKDDKVKLVSDAVNSALKSYVQGEKSRFVTAMDAAFNTMKKYEAEHGEKVTPDGYLLRKDEEGAVEQKDVEPEQEDLPDTVDMDGYIHRPEMEEFGSDKEGFEHAMAVYKALVKNPDYANRFVDEFDSAWNNYKDKGYDFPAEAAFFELGKLLAKHGIDVGSSDSDGMEEEHLEMTDKSIHELQKLMMWISEIGKKAGADSKSINKNISWIKDNVGNNARKLQKAWADLVNGADDVDIESPEAYEYALTTLDNSFKEYDRGVGKDKK